MQKVLEQQLLHHQQQLDSQNHHHQQYKKTPNGINSNKHGPLFDGPVSRGQQQQSRSRLTSINRDVDTDMASSLGDSCSDSPLGSPKCRTKTFDSSSSSHLIGSDNNNNDHHSHHHHSHFQQQHSTSHHKSSSKNSVTITEVSGTNNNKNSGTNSLTSSITGVTPIPSGSAKDFATLLSYKLHGVSGQSQSTPTLSSSSPSLVNHQNSHNLHQLIMFYHQL